jgi:hypothetical protein
MVVADVRLVGGARAETTRRKLMSVNIPEGTYQGQVSSYEFGVDNKGASVVRISMKITEGPFAGQTAQFKNGFGEKAIRYTKRALVALGWQGKDIATAKDDIESAKKTVPVQIVIAEYEGRQWSSVRSIGAFGEPLKQPDRGTLSDVNQWLSDVGDDAPGGSGGGNGTIPF